jgi:hypothetical protein
MLAADDLQQGRLAVGVRDVLEDDERHESPSVPFDILPP